ncbi:MAG: hypothetical protein R2783_02890 [Gelidibacter sp.]
MKHLLHLGVLYGFNFTVLESNSTFNMNNPPYDPKDETIYLSIDHLKKGTYRLNILLKNKVIQCVEIIKQY